MPKERSFTIEWGTVLKRKERDCYEFLKHLNDQHVIRFPDTHTLGPRMSEPNVTTVLRGGCIFFLQYGTKSGDFINPKGHILCTIRYGERELY